jgi:hypothetical protein
LFRLPIWPAEQKRGLEKPTSLQHYLSTTIPQFMPKNRMFERPKRRRCSLKISSTDVTKTARQWDAVFAMRVHPELLGKYTAPNMANDDEGYYLVGPLVREIDAELDGRIPSRLVSYGKFLAIDFEFLAQRRRTSNEEVLNLRAVLGPCDGNHPFVCVVRQTPPF